MDFQPASVASVASFVGIVVAVLTAFFTAVHHAYGVRAGGLARTQTAKVALATAAWLGLLIGIVGSGTISQLPFSGLPFFFGSALVVELCRRTLPTRRQAGGRSPHCRIGGFPSLPLAAGACSPRLGHTGHDSPHDDVVGPELGYHQRYRGRACYAVRGSFPRCGLGGQRSGPRLAAECDSRRGDVVSASIQLERVTAAPFGIPPPLRVDRARLRGRCVSGTHRSDASTVDSGEWTMRVAHETVNARERRKRLEARACPALPHSFSVPGKKKRADRLPLSGPPIAFLLTQFSTAKRRRNSKFICP